MDESHALVVAEEAARQAGEVLRSYFRHLAGVEHKGPREVVTEADRRAEARIIALIRQAFPADLILAEESYRGLTDEKIIEERRVWFIDPLDGTTNFVYGLPVYAVSIALFDRGRPVLGVVYDPSADELFSAARGEGARGNGRPIRVSSCFRFAEALLATGFPYERNGGDNLDHVTNIVPRIRDLRRMGSAALDLCYVASGRLDGFWEYGLRPWDFAAGLLIVEEAGGKVTDFRGRPMRPFSRGIAATNGYIHEELLAALARGRTGLEDPPLKEGMLRNE